MSKPNTYPTSSSSCCSPTCLSTRKTPGQSPHPAASLSSPRTQQAGPDSQREHADPLLPALDKKPSKWDMQVPELYGTSKFLAQLFLTELVNWRGVPPAVCGRRQADTVSVACSSRQRYISLTKVLITSLAPIVYTKERENCGEALERNHGISVVCCSGDVQHIVGDFTSA